MASKAACEDADSLYVGAKQSRPLAGHVRQSMLVRALVIEVPIAPTSVSACNTRLVIVKSCLPSRYVSCLAHTP